MLTYRRLDPSELNAAMRIALEGAAGPMDTAAQVEALQTYIRVTGLGVDTQWGAFDGGRLVAACPLIISPGRTAIVFVPRYREPVYRDGAVCEVLRRLVASLAPREVRLLQALIPPGSDAEEETLAAAGFRRLAELAYLQRNASPLPAPHRDAASADRRAPVEWLPYSRRRHDLFANVVGATYQGSLDCPALTGVRSMEDILASHRASGDFDPRWWQIATQESTPAGVLLMARIPARQTLELVYLGLIPQFRGRGLGRELVRRAIDLTREADCDLVTVAVDAANDPAVRLYARCGFRETSRRRAWMMVLGEPPASA